MKNSVLMYLEETEMRYPRKTAIIDVDGELSFRQLRNLSIKISRVISETVKKSHQPIFVYLPKNRYMIATFMGILYSGNFYTPTDVRFPLEKVKGILEALNPALIISDSINKENLIVNGISKDLIIDISDILYSAQSNSYSEELHDESLYFEKTIDTDIAYVLFTSGSTGVPKGVMISHRSIIDYIDWAKECYEITSNNIIGNQAPFYFDNSTFDIYLMLSTGATLHIIPEQFFSFPAKLMTYVRDNKINTIFWVPSVFINVANSGVLEEINCNNLMTILFAGEVMPNRHLNIWRRHIPDALYSNLYGPTEITVDCTYYIVNRVFDDDEPLPIGIPCHNTDVFILDQERKLITESNIIGELCVRGTSLALGYWNNLNKTKEVFIQNPLNDKFEERIYCTGDLVHYNEKNEIMFDGRKDFQIKHFGYRIELGEIETAVLGIEGIQEACVLYDSTSKKIILVYKGRMDRIELRNLLVSTIPKYMVPTEYYNIEELPYNDSGKIDRRKLEEQFVVDGGVNSWNNLCVYRINNYFTRYYASSNITDYIMEVA